MKYVSCKICNFVLETTATWRVEDDIQDHLKAHHPAEWQAAVDERERYDAEWEEFRAKIQPIKSRWQDYVMIESLPKKVGRKEYNLPDF